MNKLIAQLKKDHPELRFLVGKKFAWRAPRTITIEQDFDGPCIKLLVLHELGHALLGHKNYTVDVERIKMERAAWEKARELCIKYGVEYDEDLVEMQMDSYRDWLHQKSKCPKCGLTRGQSKTGKYICPRCDILG